MKIELHLLQNFPPACLNRDDTGQPKDCEFGGYRRARISSQCIKRSIRWHPSFSKELQAVFAQRSSHHARQIAQLLTDDKKNPKPLEDALRVGRYMFQRMGFKEKSGRLAVMPLLGDDEINVLAREAAKHWDLLSPRANESVLWEQLAERIALWLSDLGEDANMLGRLIANQCAGNANASQLDQWLKLPKMDWSTCLEAVGKMSPEILDELRGKFSPDEEGEETDGDEEDEYVPKPAASLFKGKKNKEVIDQLKTIKITGVKKTGETEQVAKQLKAIFTPLKKLTTKAVNVAMFGRMLAEIRSGDMNVDAACQVAHAISTNRVAMEFDYFTAVEELKDLARNQGVEQGAGAGMIGSVGYNSSCFYRYAVIDWEQLVKNLGDDTKLARETVKAFLSASVQAIPAGKQNTFAAHARPGFVLAVVRSSGIPINLANAFLRPVQPLDWGREDERRDLLGASADALSKHWQELISMYGNNGIKTRPACWMPKELKLPAFDDERVASNAFDDVVKQVMEALPGKV
jgi:CRISPR-associated protein Cas7/Cse4/CasC subtype I-E